MNHRKMMLLVVLTAVPFVLTQAAENGEMKKSTSTMTSSDKVENVGPKSDLMVEIKLGTDVQNLAVVGESDSFSADTDKIVGWSRVKGANDPTEIQHVWLFDGKELDTITLAVKSASYRTYSRKTIGGLTGTWTFQVKDTAGNVLASQDFTVTESASAPAMKSSPADKSMDDATE